MDTSAGRPPKPCCRFATISGAAAALLLVAACADDIVSPTFGAGCEAGEIRPGQVKIGALHEASCRTPYQFYSGSSAPYVSYAVHLEQGQAYFFKHEKTPDMAREGRNGLDAVLMLFGRTTGGASIPLE